MSISPIAVFEEASLHQVATLDQLQKVRENPEGHFIQTKDIDATETQDWNGGKGFKPIGKGEVKFTGSYNGNGYQISNLTVDRGNEDHVGLFGAISDATITNVAVKNVEVTGSDNTGGLVGHSVNSKVYNSHITGEVLGANLTGGLIGYKDEGSVVSGSYVEGKISGINGVGGVVGYNDGGDVNSSHSIDDVSGESWVGGAGWDE